MIYYKKDSIPLIRETPGIGEKSFDKYGNYIEINAFGENEILNKTILEENNDLIEYEDIKKLSKKVFLKTFWVLTNKSIKNKNEIRDSD